jgi:hypothetical protein
MNIYLNGKKMNKALNKQTKKQSTNKSLTDKLINKKLSKLKKMLNNKKKGQFLSGSNKDLKKLSTSTVDSLNNSQSKLFQKIKKKKRVIFKQSKTLISGKYLLKTLIGKGSNNKVYLAEQIFTKKLYAVKVFKLKDLEQEKKMNYLKVKLQKMFCKKNKTFFVSFIFNFLERD